VVVRYQNGYLHTKGSVEDAAVLQSFGAGAMISKYLKPSAINRYCELRYDRPKYRTISNQVTDSGLSVTYP
jgi:hypothetical protein